MPSRRTSWTRRREGPRGRSQTSHFRAAIRPHGSTSPSCAWIDRRFELVASSSGDGTDQVTVRNLEIVSVDADDNVIGGEGPSRTERRLRGWFAGETVTDERARETKMPSVDIVDLNTVVGLIAFGRSVCRSERSALYEVSGSIAAQRLGKRVDQAPRKCPVQRKASKQKGTSDARMGSILFASVAVLAERPTDPVPRSYEYKLPRK